MADIALVFGWTLDDMHDMDINELNEAGRYLIGRLQQEEGLYDISSSIDSGSKEVLLSLAPVAYDLGLDVRTAAFILAAEKVYHTTYQAGFSH